MDFNLIFIIVGILLAAGAITMVAITWRKKKKNEKAEEARLKQEAKNAEDARIAEEALDRSTGYPFNDTTPEAEVAKDYESLTRKQAAARLKHPTYYRREDLAHKHNNAHIAYDPTIDNIVAAAIIADVISDNNDNQVIEEQQNDIEELQAEVESLKGEVPSFEEEVSQEPTPEPEPQDTAPASSDDWSSSFESPSVTESSSISSSSDWNSGWSSPSESSSSSSDSWSSSSSSDSSSSSSWSSSSDSSSSWSSSSDSSSSFSGGSDW